MKHMLLYLITVSFLLQSAVVAMTFEEERQYEPVVMMGGILSAFYNVPIDELYMYAFDETQQKLVLIPFQIDERVRTKIFVLGKPWERHFYANTGNGVVDDGKFDVDDELVFLVGDLGAPAPASAWDGIQVQNNLKRSIVVSDPEDPYRYVVGYLVHSTEKKQIPATYNFSYNAQNDIVKNVNYAVRMGRPSGLIEDITFFPPLGNGVDIFDTQKIRLVGLIDLGIVAITPGLNNLPALNDRDNFHIFPATDYLSVTAAPRVRLMREVHQTIRADELLFSELGVSFFVTTKFYPYSGTLEGGASLDYATLREMFEDPDDIFIQFNLVRQSWDFNENAKNMKFYNRNNNGILVDGLVDNNVNRTINSQGTIKEWSMISGEQGTMFSYLNINDTTYQKVELYYHDNQNGGQDDQSKVDGGDTGDGKSFGDHGLKIINSQSLDLGFTAYFVGKNKDKAFAEQLAHNIEKPVKFGVFPVSVDGKKETVKPADFMLVQNFPNPFNNTTLISFSVPTTSDVRIEIYDVHGRLVRTLFDKIVFAGRHQVSWNGRDTYDRPVTTGVYLYKMVTENFQTSKKLVLVK